MNLTQPTIALNSFRDHRSAPKEHANSRFYDYAQKIAPWLTAHTIEEFVGYTRSYGQEDARSDRCPRVESRQLAELALDFHERAGTLTAKVHTNIRRIRNGAPVARVAHQPNLLASMNVVGQSAICAKMSPLISDDPVPLFFLVDYDANTDRRYRHALFPTLTGRSGFHSFSAPSIHRRNETYIFREPKPSIGYFEQAFNDLRSITQEDLAVVRRTVSVPPRSKARIAEAESRVNFEFEKAFAASFSLSEVNSRFLSRVINLMLDQPTVFVPGTEALMLAGPHLQYLWDRSQDLISASDKAAGSLRECGLNIAPGHRQGDLTAPFWLSCQIDGSRVPMQWTDASCQWSIGLCPRCNTETKIDTHQFSDLLHEPETRRIFPRVLWDDLLDGIAWPYVVGCSYRGGLEHYLFSAAVAHEMGMRILPEFFSQHVDMPPNTGYSDDFERAADVLAPIDHRAATALKLIRTGRASVLHALLWRSAEDLALFANGFRADS